MKILGIVIGGLIMLVALPFLVVGIVLVGYVGDGSGIDIPLNGLRVPPKVIAVISPEFSIAAKDVPSQVSDASVTFHITPQPGSAPLFVGLGPSRDVKRYLRGATTAHLELSDTGSGQGGGGQTPDPQAVAAGDGIDMKLQVDPGRRKHVAPPATRKFWIRQADSASGDITVGLRDITGRNLRVVVLRTDGKPGIAVDASVRVRIPLLGTVGWYVLGIGLVGSAIGFCLVIWMIVLMGRPKKLPLAAGSTPPSDTPPPV